MGDFFATQCIIVGSLIFAWGMGIELSWKLLLLVALVGFSVEMKEKIRVRLSRSP